MGLSLNCKRYARFPHINELPSSLAIALNVGDDKETRLNDRTRINLLPTLICTYVQDCSEITRMLNFDIRLTQTAGKIARTRCHCFWFCFLLAEKLTRVFLANHNA